MIVVQFSMSFVIRLLFVSSLFIISHPLAFVKRFFKLFSSFFAVPFGFAFPLVGSLYIISQPLPFVKGFFKLFSSFSRFLFGSARSLVDSLYSISHQVNFVKSFFKLFSSFFWLIVCFSSVSQTARLLYHTVPHLSIPFCNIFQLFSNLYYILYQPPPLPSIILPKPHKTQPKRQQSSPYILPFSFENAIICTDLLHKYIYIPASSLAKEIIWNFPTTHLPCWMILKSA